MRAQQRRLGTDAEREQAGRRRRRRRARSAPRCDGARRAAGRDATRPVPARPLQSRAARSLAMKRRGASARSSSAVTAAISTPAGQGHWLVARDDGDAAGFEMVVAAACRAARPPAASSAFERLVEHPQVGRSQQQAGQQHAPLLSGREIRAPAGPRGRRGAPAPGRRRGLRRSPPTPSSREREPQVLERREVVLQRGRMAEVDEVATIALPVVADVDAAPAHVRPASGGRKADQRAQQGRLAAAVLALHVQPLAGFEREVQPVEEAAFTARAGQAR